MVKVGMDHKSGGGWLKKGVSQVLLKILEENLKGIGAELTRGEEKEEE